MRELLWGGGFSLVVLIAIVVFMIVGFPGDVNSCTAVSDFASENTCYCEKFDLADVGKPGVRQPFNTWSNLYALVTGAIVGFFMWRRRKNAGRAGTSSANRMRNGSVYPIFYLCILIYLGLGSMWFHASIVEWAGVMDQISMFTYVAFLFSYSLVRATDNDWTFITYPILVAALTAGAILGAPSHWLIVIGVSLYLGVQLCIWFGMPAVSASIQTWLIFYLPALLSFGAAVVFWLLSQTGKPLCLDTHWFQFHGLWHWLAGVMAVLLYFYWVRAPR